MYYVPVNAVEIIEKFLTATELAIEKSKELTLLSTKEVSLEERSIIHHYFGDAHIFLANWCKAPAERFTYKIKCTFKKTTPQTTYGIFNDVEEVDLKYWLIDEPEKYQMLSLPSTLKKILVSLHLMEKWNRAGRDQSMLVVCINNLRALKADIFSRQSNIYSLPECLSNFSVFFVDGKYYRTNVSVKELFVFVESSGYEGSTWGAIVKNVIKDKYYHRNISDFFKGSNKGKVLKKFILKDGDRFRLSRELRIVSSFSQ